MHEWYNLYIECNISRFWIKVSAKYINVYAYIHGFTKEWLWKLWQSEWFESNFGQFIFLFLKSCSLSLTPYFPVYIKDKTKISKHMFKFATLNLNDGNIDSINVSRKLYLNMWPFDQRNIFYHDGLQQTSWNIANVQLSKMSRMTHNYWVRAWFQSDMYAGFGDADLSLLSLRWEFCVFSLSLWGRAVLESAGTCCSPSSSDKVLWFPGWSRGRPAQGAAAGAKCGGKSKGAAVVEWRLGKSRRYGWFLRMAIGCVGRNADPGWVPRHTGGFPDRLEASLSCRLLQYRSLSAQETKGCGTKAWSWDRALCDGE